jgi:hypothetical protein
MLNTMGFYLWLMPVLFMIHEFEEIFMIEAWSERHKEKINQIWPTKKPFGLDNAGPYLSACIGIGIFSEFIMIFLICLICVIFQNYYAWVGIFVGFLIHMLSPHGTDVIKFKGYTPGIITGAIVFIPCLWVLYQANTILHYGVLEVALSTVGMWLVEGFITFKVLHKAMASWSKQLYQYAQAGIKE